MPKRDRPIVVFAEEDPSFVQLAAMLSPTYASTMGPSTGGAANWPKITLAEGQTNDDFVAEMHRAYAPDVDPEIRFAEDDGGLVAAAKDADVLVTERTPIDGPLLDALGTSVTFVQKFGAWVPSIDFAAAADHGVMVATWRRSANRRVAEHVLLLMLGLVRRVIDANESVARFDPSTGEGPGASRYRNNWVGLDGLVSLGGLSVGLIGLGEVGSEVALLLRGFDVRVSYAQRRRNEQSEALLGVEFRDLDDLLSSSDIVSVHLPLNPQTEGFLSARELGLMRPSSYLVNVSRGRLVDEQALVDALRGRALAGAAFDTFWNEPLDPTHQLVGMENVILTPHVAAGAVDAALFRSEFSGPLVNITRVLTGRLPFGVVNMPGWPAIPGVLGPLTKG